MHSKGKRLIGTEWNVRLRMLKNIYINNLNHGIHGFIS